MANVFISYRREDAGGHAGRLFDHLRKRPEAGSVFMDVSGIEPGVDFVATIERAVGGCDVLLAVIGKSWAQCRDENGGRRLDDADDFVRIETATALRRGIRVIPVLVQGAQMPRREELPEDLQALRRRQAVELRDARWDDDADFLIGQIAATRGAPRAGAGALDACAEPQRGERPGAPTAAPARPGSRTFLIGGVVVMLLGAAGAVWFQPAPTEPPAAVPPLLAQSPPADAAPAVPPPAVSVPATPAPIASIASGAARNVKVYVHTGEAGDRALLEEVGNALRSHGYAVPDTRLSSASTAGDVRFFFASDRAEADRVRQMVEAELGRRGRAVALQLLERDGTKFPHATPGKIEVWLPRLAAGA